jgi:hypothetical protein
MTLVGNYILFLKNKENFYLQSILLEPIIDNILKEIIKYYYI